MSRVSRAFFLYALFSIFAFSVSIHVTHAATLLSDDFTGTTIDSAKWNELDATGAGGTSGNVQQNGTLTIANGYSGSVWGQTALYSVNTFSTTGLEVQARLSPASDTLLGYGDYNFQSAGTAAVILDIQAGGNILALSWVNGSFNGLTSCGNDAATHTYKLKSISGGFEIYKDGALICTHSFGFALDNKKVFLEASASASTFDDVLVTGAVAATVPDAPSNFVADPGNTNTALSWTAPSQNGSPISDYVVQYKLSTEPVTWTTFADGVATTTSVTVTGLTNGLSYDFRVNAVNAMGDGPKSSIASGTPSAPTVPGVPTGLSALIGNQQVALSWMAPVLTGGSPITDYLVQYKLSSEPSVWSTFIDGVSTAVSATVTALTNALSYDFKVSTVNAVGTGTGTTITAAPQNLSNVLVDDFAGTTINTTKWTEVDPSGIGGTTGEVLQNGSLSIANSYVGGVWGATALVSQEAFSSNELEISAVMSQASAPLIGYGDYLFGALTNKAYLLYITGPGASQILALAWSNGSYESTGCGNADATPATYKMKIITGGFEVYKNGTLMCTHNTSIVVNNKNVFLESSTTASTFDDVVVRGILTPHTAPGAPTIGTATAGNAAATVTFTPPGNNGGTPITAYTVTASPGGQTATGASSPLTVTGLTNGTSYTFTVTATNTTGTSSSSASSNGVTPSVPAVPAQVGTVTATPVNEQVLLDWDAPGNGGAPITDYVIEYKLSTAPSWTTFTDGTSTSTKAMVTALTNGYAYDFRVSAVNSGGAGLASAPVSATPQAISNLAFVITGESNSGGIGLNSDATLAELAPRSAVQIMNLTSGLFGFENIDVGTNNLRDHAGLEGYYTSAHGFELQLTNSTEAHAFPDNEQVYLIKTGHGGSQVSQWNVGSGYWNKFLERINAGKTQIPAGRQWVVWMSLGINDAIAGTPTSTWKTAMVAHINKIKTELPGAIIILTQFQSMTNQSGYATYNTVMSEIADEEANVYVVDSTGAALRDTNHWSYAGLKTVTSRMVDITKSALGLVYPGIPGAVSATPGSATVALSWSAPIADGGNAITDYRVEYSVHNSNTWTTFNDGVSTTPSTTVTGLTDSTAYDFKVSAINSNGAGNPRATSATTTDGTGPVLTVITATPTNTSVTITWDSSEIASTAVDYGLTASYGTTPAETDTSPRVTAHSVVIASLVPCASYHYRVRSRDAALNITESTDHTFTTTGCTGSAPVVTESSAPATTLGGGTVALVTGGTSLTLSIPAGATGTDAVYQIKALTPNDVFTSAGSPSGVIRAGSYAFDLKALTGTGTAVTSFAQPITLTLNYAPQDIAGINEANLVIYRWDGATWSPLSNCSVNTSTHTVTCTTVAFSVFSIFGSQSLASGGNGMIFTGDPTTLPGYTAPRTIVAQNSTTTTPIQISSLLFRDLELGAVGSDVLTLQKFLNTHGATIAQSGPGAPGLETTIFGYATKNAVAMYQRAQGINPVTGNVGPKTRANINGSAVPVISKKANTPTFTQPLYLGMTHPSVRVLQQILNRDVATRIAENGLGSAGNESDYFGTKTKEAVKRFQIKYGLIQTGAETSAGFVGPQTRVLLNEMQ